MSLLLWLLIPVHSFRTVNRSYFVGVHYLELMDTLRPIRIEYLPRHDIRQKTNKSKEIREIQKAGGRDKETITYMNSVLRHTGLKRREKKERS